MGLFESLTNIKKALETPEGRVKVRDTLINRGMFHAVQTFDSMRTILGVASDVGAESD